MRTEYFIATFKECIDIPLAKNPNLPAHWRAEKEALYQLLQTAFGGTVNITESDLKGIQDKFYASLATSGLSKDFVEIAKITWGNVLNYAQKPMTLSKVGDQAHNKKFLMQTKQACTYGYQHSPHQVVRIDPKLVEEMQALTKRYDHAEVDAISITSKYSKTEVRVIAGDCLTTAKQLKEKGFNPALLNLANADAAGGGAEQGGFAQEESIYYRSNYYQSLDRTYNPGPTPLYPIPEFGGIYTPHVQVVRDERYQFTPPWSISLIASAAYVATSVSHEVFMAGTEKKIKAILRIAAVHGHDCVILGAFGCGAFRKDENTKVLVSQIFEKVLRLPEFSGAFRNITFAIIHDTTGNFQVFSHKFNFDMHADLKEAKDRREALETDVKDRADRPVEVSADVYIGKWARIEEHTSAQGRQTKVERMAAYQHANAEGRKKMNETIDAELALVDRANDYAKRAMMFNLYSNRADAYYAIYTPCKQGRLDIAQTRESALVHMETTHAKQLSVFLKNQDEARLSQFLSASFEPGGNCSPYSYDRLNLAVDLTAHYSSGGKPVMPIPRIPFFHPYNPNGDTEKNATEFGGFPGAIVTVRCPREVIKYCPVAIQALILTNNIDINKIDIFFVTQNMPWKDSGLLFRPHYWIHGDKSNDAAVKAATFTQNTPCRMGIFASTDESMACDGHKDALSGAFGAVSSHPGKPKVEDKKGAQEEQSISMTICSPPNTGVMTGYHFEQTNSLCSVALANDGRMAITFHWLLNSADQKALTEISRNVHNLKEFIQAVALLENSRLNMPKGPLSQLTALLNTQVDLANRALAAPVALAAAPILHGMAGHNARADDKEAVERIIASLPAKKEKLEEFLRYLRGITAPKDMAGRDIKVRGERAGIDRTIQETVEHIHLIQGYIENPRNGDSKKIIAELDINIVIWDSAIAALENMYPGVKPKITGI